LINNKLFASPAKPFETFGVIEMGTGPGIEAYCSFAQGLTDYGIEPGASGRRFFIEPCADALET
jgi:hypothetical protein